MYLTKSFLLFMFVIPMKKYYAISNSYSYNSKDTWEKMYALWCILQSKFPVRWIKSLYFDENQIREVAWQYLKEEESDLWLFWLYLEWVESIEVVREKRTWYWIKNYSIKWVDLRKDPKDNKDYYHVFALLDSDYSVNSLRDFKLSVDQFSTLFADVNTEEKCYWLKDKNLQVIEYYKVIKELPTNYLE